MFISDKEGLYIKEDAFHKMMEIIGIDGTGIYITIKLLEFDYPDGVDIEKIVRSSLDETGNNKKTLDRLIREGYVEYAPNGARSTNKRFD